jgi:hypothetical protein
MALGMRRITLPPAARARTIPPRSSSAAPGGIAGRRSVIGRGVDWCPQVRFLPIIVLVVPDRR